MEVRVKYRGSLNFGGLGLLTNVGLDFGEPADSVYSADYTIDMLRTNDGSDDRLHLRRRFRRVACGGLRMTIRKGAGSLRFSVPQRCFGEAAGRVRVTGYTYRPRAAPDQADYLDEWSGWIRGSAA